MKILIIDDSRIIRERIVSQLKELGHFTQILEADSAKAAKDILSREKPDKIILDLRLPDISGVDLLKWIKEHDSRIEILVLTNYPYPEYERKCLQYGASYFLDKNSDLDKVYDILSK